MNQHRSRPRQRFEREEAQRRLYVENARNLRTKNVSPQRYFSSDSPKFARHNRSASNPDVTEFWRQETDSNLASRYLQNDRDFESEGLSDQEVSQFEGNGGSRSYVSAKRNVPRPKSSENVHEPIKTKRSRSLGEIDKIQDSSRIYEPIEQLYNYARKNNPRNSLGNASRDSGTGYSRPGSPKLSRSPDYDHLSPRTPPRDYDPNRRPSYPVISHHPYEVCNPKIPNSPLLTRKRSNSYDNYLSNATDQYPRRTSGADQYESLDGQARSLTEGSHASNDNRSKKDDYIRVPGPGHENWIMRRKSLFLDRGEQVQQNRERPNFTPPRRPVPKPITPPRSPRPKTILPKPPVPTPRRGSREDLSDAGAKQVSRPKSPKHDKQNSMDSQKSDNAYDNIRDALNSLLPQQGSQPSSPNEQESLPDDGRPLGNNLVDLPHIMVQPGTQPPSPNEQENLPDDRGPLNDHLDGLPSIMVQPGTRPSSPDGQESLPGERRPSSEQIYRYPNENQNRPASFDNFGRQSSGGESPNEPPFKHSPSFSNGSLPMGFSQGGFPSSPSIADTSISRETYNSNLSNYRLTVENRANQEREAKEEDEFCTNVYVITTKYIAVILTALLVLFCVTANKICLLVIGNEYSLLKDNNTLFKAHQADGKDRSKYSSKESIVIMLVIILMIPQAISLFYGIWGEKKSQKWPRKSAILWIIFGGIIEASCLSFLCIYVLTVLNIEPSLFLLFISGLFVIPTIIQISLYAKRWETKKGKMRIVTFTIAAGMQITGLILLVYTKKEMMETTAKFAIPITIALLSIAWSPKIRRLQTKPVTPVAAVDPPAHHGSFEDFDFEDDDEAVSVAPNVTLDSPPPPRKQAAREKAAIVMALVQLITTPLASVIFCKGLGIVDLDKLGKGFDLISSDHPAFYFFLTQILVTFIGYHMAWLACSMYAQRPAFALPLTLATPLALILIEVRGSCENHSFIPLRCGPQEGEELYYMIAVAVLMLTGQFLSTGYYVWANMGYIMGKASHLFWLPSYTGILLEPFLLLNRRNKVTDDKHVASKRLARDSYVFICTTMYHEVQQEMEQLLSSIHDIDVHFKDAGRHVESHIFFDGCIKAEVMNSYILQLASVVEYTLKVKLADVTKVLTPYGMQLRWTLPGGLPVTIHLKDNTKVKNKKRWSQVMYMSYILDYKQRIYNVPDDQTYILTTDADVKFTHESMEALLDYMVQDEGIGAVCGRTHPLGNGPMVWYQIFDYAIGHWFMKVANHVFGSVLCCPGCFSLYRCQAVRDILPTYSTTVSEAFEFLTKDMGEDRWMCTLMVQAGWRLAYCAAAEDQTYCPMEFEEFYKQRRRWMPSTLANLGLLVSEWRTVLKNNENISFPFIIYQVVLLCATLIGPSIVILFIVGGLVNMGMDEITAAVLMSVTTIGYGLICLFFPQSTQITVAKFLTFIFAVIMIVVTIGLAVQINKEIKDREELREENRLANYTLEIDLHKQLPAGISTLYLGGLVAIFLIAAMLHPKEALCLLNGIWYLLCLPSGYLLLTVYSVVNMTDRSWGTREGKTKGGKEVSPLDVLWEQFKVKCACCLRPFAAKENKPPEPEAKNKQESRKDRLKRVLSRKSRKSTKSTESNASRKGRRSRKNSKELDSEMDSESASESTRGKSKSDKGTLRKLRLAIRHSLKGIGFFKDDDQVEDRHQMQSGDTIGRMQQQQQGSGDERYSGNQSGFPPLPVDPLLHHRSNHENKGYDEGMDTYPGAPGYPTVIPNTPPEDGDRRNKASPIYDEIHPQPNRYPYSEVSYPSLKNPNVDRVKSRAQSGVEFDSDYGSSSSSSQQYRPRRGSRADMMNTVYEGVHLEAGNLDGVSYMGTSIGGISSFALLTSDDIHLPVEEWLKGDLKEYTGNFRKHGYDSIAFICSMKEKDLEYIGIKKRGHRQKIAREITKLPKHEIEEDIPIDVGEWLEDLGLEEYIDAFDENGYNEPTDLEDLKNMDKDTVKETFNITKVAHLNMLCQAINKLQYANQGQKVIRKARRELLRVPTHLLEYYNNDGGDEYEFWENLRQSRLIPEMAGFDGNTELKEKLQDLRNSAVMIFLVANTLWMIVIMVLVRQSSLKTLGVDLIGLSFLLVYGTIIILQFLAMIGHRLTTLLHVLARASWTCCQRKKMQAA
ncbi:uncharacterized protein LOC116308782 isoform X2 [Actinia tenebrosa]|uniref:chitin synthase n=1 Tax=Actinia tenebrosa TaxID=6105 RepID=A0A6P8JBY0_ACTTE|nr:uncharacterized protein LOC116308782 isoform X2 [Actinia tenebrosa]